MSQCGVATVTEKNGFYNHEKHERHKTVTELNESTELPCFPFVSVYFRCKKAGNVDLFHSFHSVIREVEKKRATLTCGSFRFYKPYLKTLFL